MPPGPPTAALVVLHGSEGGRAPYAPWLASQLGDGALIDGVAHGERAMPFGSGSRIAIERYPGPLWLSHGEADPLWPVSRSRKLASERGALPTEIHVWPGEGHTAVTHQVGA